MKKLEFTVVIIKMAKDVLKTVLHLFKVQRRSKDRFTFVQKKTNMSVSSLMIDKFHQNLSALKVHCFCDCKERRHY